ncbi:MAG TPA: hypothetical protein VHM24_09710 [Gemmatimonadaceae bacterium]|nr:hypothetical protein [Gemmatimonadaceae bacterium]
MISDPTRVQRERRGLLYPPFAAPGGGPTPGLVADVTTPSDDLAPIETFLDEEEPQESAHGGDEMLATSAADFENDRYDEEGWAVADWQSFDWSGLQSLTKIADRHVAEAEWSATTWAPLDLPQLSETEGQPSGVQSSAHEVAGALIHIADLIRSGKLAVDNLHGTPPEAVMAAALAALIRMRR